MFVPGLNQHNTFTRANVYGTEHLKWAGWGSQVAAKTAHQIRATDNNPKDDGKGREHPDYIAKLHLLELLDTFGRAQHVGQADTELLVHHDHFALGNQGAVNQHVQRLASKTVKLDHRALV